MLERKNLISKLLQKWGINKEEDLTVEEKQTLDRYKGILFKEVTVENITDFLAYEISLCEEKLSKPDSIKDHDVNIKAILYVALKLQKLIKSPEAEREALERQLTSLIES